MHEERFVRSFDGTQLYSRAEGAPGRPPLVFCDGLGCDGFIWKYLRQTLAPHYRLIFWNYRGHGRSAPPKDEGAVDVAALKNDLAAVLVAHDVTQPVLLGHSMGAQVVFDFALDRPGEVAGVVSLCGSFGRPLDWLHGSPAIGRLFPLLRNGMLAYPAQGRRLWQWFFEHRWSFAAAHRFEVNAEQLLPHDFKPYFAHLSVMDPATFVRLVDAMQAHSVQERIGELRAPTLLVAGEQDTFCPSHLSEEVHGKIVGAQLVVVKQGSHVAPLERPRPIEAELLPFLRRCTSAV